MPTPRVHAWSAAGLLLLTPGTGCVERVIRELGQCGDGVLSAGEVCLGQGERLELPIEGLEGLLLRAADFDGDAHVDLLVVGTDPGGVVVARLWQGGGDGTFAAPVDPGVRGCSAYAVAGDGNGDMAADLLVDDCGTTMSLFAGTSTGIFDPPQTVNIGLETRSSGMVDLDEDGQREVIVLGDGPTGWGISIAERSAAGQYDSSWISTLSITYPGFAPTGFGLLDLDLDGSLDALLIHSGRVGSLAVAYGLPSGMGFGSARPVEPAGPVDLVANTMLVRDLDEDGRTDVLAVSFDQEALLFLRSEDGELVERGRTTVPELRVGPAGAGDIDADEHEDLLLFEPGESTVQAWLGQGDGTFEDPVSIDLETAVGQIALVDLDEDGALDIVAATFEQGSLQVLLSDP